MPVVNSAKYWRPRPELNRGTRFCRPLRNHSATWPLRSADVESEITIRRALRQAGYTGATPGGQPFGKAEDWVPATGSPRRIARR
jgi:hypothetical protein